MFLQTYAFYNYILVDFYWSGNKAATYCLETVSPSYRESIDSTIVEEGTFDRNIGILVAFAFCARLVFTVILWIRGTLANV